MFDFSLNETKNTVKQLKNIKSDQYHLYTFCNKKKKKKNKAKCLLEHINRPQYTVRNASINTDTSFDELVKRKLNTKRRTNRKMNINNKEIK